MNANRIYWMRYSINISTGDSKSNLRVGAVLVSEENKLLCSAFTGEELHASWCAVLLSKVRKLNIFKAQYLYLTINTLEGANSFDLNALLKEVYISEIYIGLPDPSLTCYLDSDPIMTCNYVYRYPDELQLEILKQTEAFFADSKQAIKYSPYYSEHRISNLIIEKLQLKGFCVSKEELNENKQKYALASLLCQKYGIGYSESLVIVCNAISEAFDSKYGIYSYSYDARSLDASWQENFMSFYKKSSSNPLSTMNILNVGVGSGYEATVLFSNCQCVTYVDIAQTGLEKIKELIPLSRVIVSSADVLSSIADNSYDLYVSLRTYNSSFFNINEAILEAHRVLKPNAVIVISVANGFLCPERHCVIPGLIISGTEIVDIYRGMDTIKLIYSEFIQSGFKNIQIWPTNTEIYISAVAT